MATVVNTRDLQLAATSPRLAGIVLPSNVTVPGLSGVIAATKNVSLAATSQIFQIPKTGSISPANITLSATVNNLVTAPTLTITSGTMSVTPALTGGTFTFTSTQMTSDTVTLKLQVVESSVTYADTMTFVKCREGIDSINVILSNENVTLSADNIGNVLSYATANGAIKVYQGINDVTSVCTFAVASNPSGLTNSLVAGPSGTGGQYSVTAGYPAGTDVTSITYNVTFGTTVVPVVFTLSKSKAGANGTSGSPGTRGSVTVSVGLSGTLHVWSDATAVSAISTYTGTSPIRLDEVTEYNNSQGFSQTKFYDGAAWQLVSAVIDGSLLVTGTVGANALAANSVDTSKLTAQAVTTDKLLVTGQGKALNPDPAGVDLSAWIVLTGTLGISTTASSPVGTSALALTASGSGSHLISKTFPIVAARTYKINVFIKSTSASGLLYVRMLCLDSGGTLVNYQVTAITPAVGTFEAIAVPTSWTQYTGKIIAGANTTQAYLEMYSNWSTGSGTTYLVDFRCEEQIDASLIVDGSISATQINARGLALEDAAGTVIFSSGTTIGNDAATTLGFNPTFSAWSGVYPDNWNAWANTPSKDTVHILSGSPYSVGWTTPGASASVGMYCTYTYPTAAPLPAGSFLTGSFSIQMLTNNGGGPPGYLVRLFTNAAQTTFVDSIVVIPNQTTSGWQKFPFTATANGQAIYAIQIYQMASWPGMPGGAAAAGNIIVFGPFTFNISSQITSGTASTHIAAGAIDSLQIGNLRTSNYTEDGSGNPTAGAKLSSTGTAFKVANSGFQIGTAIFTDYWVRLVQGIDGASGTAIIWRGNNDASTRGGAPNINCLSLTTQADQTITNNFQQTYLTYILTPTSYTSYTDNLDAMTQIHIQFFNASTVSSPFTETYQPMASRTYDGASGIVQGSLAWGWRYGGTGAVTGASLETNNAYNAYVRVRIANTYGFSATKDLYGGGGSAAVGRVMTATTITGSAGSSGGGGGSTGGACPAPWVKITLLGGRQIDASDLFDGSVLEAVNDNDLSYLPRGGIVRDPKIVWRERIRLTLTNGSETEWSRDHRFCLTSKEWVRIQDLQPGDHIMGPVENIVQSIQPTGEGPVVAFRVEGAGTYFSANMLSHNNKVIP